MLKKIISVLLIGFVMNLAVVATFAQTKEEKDAKFALKIKANVEKLGTGTDSKIEVKLKDGTKIMGYVSEIKEKEFAVMDSKAGQQIPVSYTNVKQVKGKNSSTNTLIGVGLGIGAAIIILIIIGNVAKGS